MQSKMQTIRCDIERVLDQLSGDFVVPKNAYEKKFCELLGWQAFDARYYDAYNGETYIEIKKGQSSMHFDMVRYAEIVMGFGTQNTITVFFKWNKNHKRVDEAMLIDTLDLIKFLKIDKVMARMYLKIRDLVPRGVNILASATCKDLREISTHVITNVAPIYRPLTIRFTFQELEYTTDPNKWPNINIIIE